MNHVGDVLMANVTKTVQKAAIAAASEAITRTPVKTGNARINWNTTFGSPSGKLSKPPDSGNRDMNAQVAAASALINASNALKGWKVGKGNIYIANPVSYIFDLDRGTSAQARSGMIIFALAAAREVLRQGRLLRG